MQPLMNIAVRAAREAGDIINQYVERLDRVQIAKKQQNDLVTEVDHLAEAAIIEVIRKNFPHHGILAEESGEHPGEEYTWIIDPLDGTTNYAYGFPHFAVSIAVMRDNMIEYGVVYDPVRNELFSAVRGSGALLNNRRIRVGGNDHLKGALLGTGFPIRNPDALGNYLKTFTALLPKAAGVRRAGSAALDLAYVAAGRLDGYWEFSLKPWDVAAGSLLVKEAGGLVSDREGGETYLKTGDIVAGSPKIFKEILQAIRKVD